MSEAVEILKNAIQNAIAMLPVGVKGDLGVHFQRSESGLRVSGTDGYSFVTQLIEGLMPGNGARFLDKKNLQAWLKEDDFGVDELTQALQEHGVESIESVIPALVGMATGQSAESIMTFSWSPDRVKKLGSLKPAGLPIHCEFDSNEHVRYVRFSYGDAQGVFTLLEDQ